MIFLITGAAGFLGSALANTLTCDGHQMRGLDDLSTGAPFTYINHRSESVLINGQGLYFYDTVSSAAQMQGNDLISLPLLVFVVLWAWRGSLREHLPLTGTLGFFLYTQVK
jgi:hypothetical protein